MEKDAKIYVAGHTGLVGSALCRKLAEAGYERVLAPEPRPDLTHPDQVEQLFDRERPDHVIVAAAKVGGIHANSTARADFIRVNLEIATHVIDAAHRHGVKKLLFLGSSCIYPKLAPQPMKEEHLLTGPLEDTNEAYAIAKIAGLMLCKSYNIQHGTNFICAMPTNLYGPRDNFDKQTSHVLPALIRKFHEAKLTGADSVSLWGTGTPRREFLHVDDLAAACLFMMQRFDATPEQYFLNVGVGRDIPILELAQLIADVVGYSGNIHWDTSMPDGTPRKLLDVSR
jgi:GDP-L-fucose synthase